MGYQVRVVTGYPLVPVKSGYQVPPDTWYEGLLGTPPYTRYKGLPGNPWYPVKVVIVYQVRVACFTKFRLIYLFLFRSRVVDLA